MSDSNDNDEITLQPKVHSFVKRSIGLILAVVVVSFISYQVYVYNTSGDGRIIEQVQNKVVVAPLVIMTSRYYSMTIPQNFTEDAVATRGAGQLDLHVIKKRAARDNPDSMRVSMGIEKLPAGGVTQMSPYFLAAAHPENYKITTKPCQTSTCHILYKYDDGGTYIMLWPHNTVVLLIAMSTQAVGTPPSYEDMATHITESLQWK